MKLYVIYLLKFDDHELIVMLVLWNMQNWLEFLPGKWRMLYCTGRHIGLTLRQPPTRILVGYVHLTVTRPSKSNTNLSFTSDISFTVMTGREWPHDKTGITGKLQINSLFRLMAGRRLYIKEEKTTPGLFSSQSDAQNSLVQKLSGKKWRKAIPFKDIPSSLSVAKLVSGDIELTMSLGHPLNRNVDAAKNIVQEVRTQIPPEMFDLSKFVCGTYVDSRFLVLRGVNGSALLFTRSCASWITTVHTCINCLYLQHSIFTYGSENKELIQLQPPHRNITGFSRSYCHGKTVNWKTV